MYRLHRLWNPPIFQGRGRKDDYFEGWYFKLVDEELENIYAVIPGVSIKGSREDSHAFIQLLDGKNASSSYFDFSMADFSYSEKRFEINIGRNYFSADSMYLDIGNGRSRVKADISFKNRVNWPVTILSPGAMGWYAFVPFMECYHGVVSMDHDLYGSMSVDGRKVRLEGGKGYIEKDWGNSFPEGWIWLQSNNFSDDNPCSIMVSVAKIPWRGRSFTGFICGLYCRGRFYIFATHNRSRIIKLEYNKSNDEIKLELAKKDLVLEICAKKNKSGELASPVMGAMEGRINESIDSKIEVILSKSDKILINDIGEAGGFEMINPQVLEH